MATAELKTRISADARDFNRAMAKVKSTISQVSAAIGGFSIGASLFATKEAFTFEKQMAEIGTLLGKGGEELRVFKNQVIELGIELGATTDVLTKGLYDALSSGVGESDAIDFLRASTKLATAGVSDTATATKLLTGVMGAYGLSADHAARVSDKMFATVVAGRTTIEGLSSSMGNVAPIAAAFGVSINDLSAAFATAVKSIGSSEQTATSLKGVLASLATPTKALLDVYDKLGVSSGEELVKKFGSFQDALQAVASETDGTLTSLKPLFGRIEGLLSVTALTGKGFQQAKKDLGALRNSTGAADKAFKLMSNTMDFRFNVIKAQVQKLALIFGDQFTPALLAVGDAISKALANPDVIGSVRLTADLLGAMAKIILSIVQNLILVKEGLGALGGEFISQFKDLSDKALTFQPAATPAEINKFRAASGAAAQVAGGNMTDSLLTKILDVLSIGNENTSVLRNAEVN